MCWPFQSTLEVPGRSVVSALHRTPLSAPTRTTEWRSLTGKRRFVIGMGCENVGAVMSTRWTSGASRSRVRSFSLPSAGCGIMAELRGVEPELGGVAPEAGLPVAVGPEPPPVHEPPRSTIARPMPSSAAGGRSVRPGRRIRSRG